MNATDPESITEHPFALRPRSANDWCDLALVTQANLVPLRVRQCRRNRAETAPHPIQTPAPGAVKRMREHLLDRRGFAEMSDRDLALRLRQVWGQFSAFCWLMKGDDPNHPPSFAKIDADQARCPMELADRVENVRRTLWRVRFEQQLRFVGDFRLRPDFHDLKLAAGEIAVDVYGRPVHMAPPDAVVLYGCETAGVFATLRWAMDDRWDWEQPGISDVGLE
ncbi:MAG: hypothetical protein IID33_07645 [Planctomycetes bacterium]|nr:hypothetical protein [Planctomycetota bacterium]